MGYGIVCVYRSYKQLSEWQKWVPLIVWMTYIFCTVSIMYYTLSGLLDMFVSG